MFLDLSLHHTVRSSNATHAEQNSPTVSVQGCKIPLARSHWRVNIDGGRVKLAMRSPDRASVFSSSEFVIIQSFGRKNGKTPT